ncbi:hypothetical protein [Clostridium perfringens]|jgi:hypothetical protein|uniref:Uncharacterized protein n=2 Tax=Clostridium TaxID=1485 RepID=A0AAW9KJZ0_CLOPF|nr:hypothetical protein [Clostridium perfringens]MDZ4905250.1 hypothetical protein [Clostridium perfringens]MDZ7541385.1 hypothetical protein [Clostridium perfringens]
MGFSIFQFNKKKLQELMFGENGINLNCGDLGLLNEIVDKYNSLPKYDIDGNGKTYVWINYEMLKNDFPILSMNIGTYRNVCRKLEKLGFIEKEDRAIKLQGGDCKKKTFFRPTELTLSLITTEADIKAQVKEKEGLQPVEEKSVEGGIEAPKDSNGNTPIKGQVHFTEIDSKKDSEVKEKSEVEKIIEVTGCTIEKAEEVLEYAVNCSKNNPIGFAIKAIEGKWKLENKETNGVNPRSFNNFKGREYDYDKLESMLLGYEEYSEEDIHEVLSNARSGNYTSNNSERFNGVEIGTNVAV